MTNDKMTNELIQLVLALTQARDSEIKAFHELREELEQIRKEAEINKAILTSFINLMDENHTLEANAKAILKSICKGEVNNIKISY